MFFYLLDISVKNVVSGWKASIISDIMAICLSNDAPSLRAASSKVIQFLFKVFVNG